MKNLSREPFPADSGLKGREKGVVSGNGEKGVVPDSEEQGAVSDSPRNQRVSHS